MKNYRSFIMKTAHAIYRRGSLSWSDSIKASAKSYRLYKALTLNENVIFEYKKKTDNSTRLACGTRMYLEDIQSIDKCLYYVDRDKDDNIRMFYPENLITFEIAA